MHLLCLYINPACNDLIYTIDHLTHLNLTIQHNLVLTFTISQLNSSKTILQCNMNTICILGYKFLRVLVTMQLHKYVTLNNMFLL